MTDQQTSYRNIVKATSLFGGVQVIIVIIGLIRTKFVAVLLGTTGFGLLGLFNATLSFIEKGTGFGLGYSAVRDISEAAGSGEVQRVTKTINTFRRWVLFTGCLGVFVTVVLAPWLSLWTFGDKKFTWAFVWLSITLFLNAVSSGQKAILQGMRKLRDMAKATVLGSLLGLVTSLPLYYFYGTKGIVPALIITATTSLILSWYFARRVSIPQIPLSFEETFSHGKGMVRMGFLLSISSQIGALVSYILISFISRTGGTDQVGLFSAGTGLINTSAGLVFAAMATDYYPRLAAINNDNSLIKVMVNQQGVISILLLLPIVLLILVFMPLIVRLFLSQSFLSIIPFVNLMVLGVLIKAASWVLGYISFAKGDSKVYFWLEGIMSNTLNLILCVVFYRWLGLIGIGIAYISLYMVYFVIVYFIAKKRYSFSWDRASYYILLVSLLLTLLGYLTVTYAESFVLYSMISIILIAAILFSYYELNRRIDLKALAVSLFNNYLKDKRHQSDS